MLSDDFYAGYRELCDRAGKTFPALTLASAGVGLALLTVTKIEEPGKFIGEPMLLATGSVACFLIARDSWRTRHQLPSPPTPISHRQQPNGSEL